MYRHLLLFLALLIVVGSLPARAQDDAVEASCVGIHEIALTVPLGTQSNANDSFLIQVWHLDEFLATEDNSGYFEPFYSYNTVPYYKDSRGDIHGSECAWTAETNWAPVPPSIPSTGKAAVLPPNAPYVIEVLPPAVGLPTGHDWASRSTYTYALCNPAETDPRVPTYDAEAFGFYCPYGGSAPNQQHQDLLFRWDGSELHVRPFNLPLGSFEGVSAALADEFGTAHAKDWVLPYDYDAACQAIDGHQKTSCPAGEIGSDFFISPQVGYDYTFAPVDLDLRAPWAWTWTDAAVHSVRLQPGTKFIVEGDLVAEGVTLRAATTDIVPAVGLRWGGVAVYASGSLNFEGVTVSGAVVGLDVYSDDVALSNTTLAGNGIGLRSSYVQNYCPGLQACLVGNESRFTLEGVQITNNSGIGVLARNARDVVMRAIDGTNTRISHNGGAGLSLWNAAFGEFRNTRVEQNAVHGIVVGDNSDLRFLSVDLPNQPALDRVAENGGHEIVLSEGAYLFLGKTGSPNVSGFSDIYDASVGPNNRLIYFASACNGLCALTDVDAENVYWGSPSGPPAGAFEGLYVDTSPFLTSPATSGSRPASPVEAEFVAEAGTAGRGEGSDMWLRQAIQEARRGLEEAPGAEGAAALVRRLYGLQRLDADDRLGEHGATMARLSALRGHLDQGHLPAALRAAAEAALVAEVHDGLRQEVYEEAEGLLTAYQGTVESAQARRALTLSRVMVHEQAGRYVEALDALASVTAEMEAEDPLLGVLDAVAEALATKGDGGVGGRTGEAGLAAASALKSHAAAVAEVLGAPYPNPARDATTLTLQLAEGARVDVAVYDVLGRRVARLAEGRLEAGAHRLALDGASLPAGVYVVRAAVEAGGGAAQVHTRRLTLVR